ncbi:MAG TPA: glycosyltransferase family 2 protein [Bryobacteraceae bacterium]
MTLSVVIPARDEAGSIEATLSSLIGTLRGRNIPFEIVVVNDGSTDGTPARVAPFLADGVKLVHNLGRHGFGIAVRVGLELASGDAVAIMMADGSDSPDDLVRYYEQIQKGFDCVFGSRFTAGGKVVGYPWYKLIVNRLANWFIMLAFGIHFNDVTNAFKCYRKEVIAGIQPLISPHFNLTVELPLKAIVRGYSFTSIPITWTNRAAGMSKLKLKEMGSRYLFIVLYLWLEKHLSRGDYHRHTGSVVEYKAADEPHV